MNVHVLCVLESKTSKKKFSSFCNVLNFASKFTFLYNHNEASVKFVDFAN